MTLAEVCKILGRSEKTITQQFNRTQERLLKKGIVLTRTGRGESADYQISYVQDEKENK